MQPNEPLVTAITGGGPILNVVSSFGKTSNIKREVNFALCGSGSTYNNSGTKSSNTFQYFASVN